MKKNLYINTESIVILFFLIINYVYFSIFTANYLFYYNENSFFYFPLNYDAFKLTYPFLQSYFLEDESIYSRLPHYFLSEVFFERSIFQIGITLIYVMILFFAQFFTDNILFVSFLINNFLILTGYYYYKKILRNIFGIFSARLELLYFINPILIWYSQGINKDIFLITLFIPIIYYFYTKEHFKVFLLGLAVLLIRVPYFFVIPILYALFYIKNKFVVAISIYATLSISSAFFFTENFDSRSQSNISNTVFGISSYVFKLNEATYVGNLLLNPIRALLLIFDQLRSINIFKDESLNLFNLANAPITIYFLYNFRRIITLFKLFFFKRTKLSVILYFIFSIILIGLMPTVIHARYIAPIIYPLFLILIYYNTVKGFLNHNGMLK